MSKAMEKDFRIFKNGYNFGKKSVDDRLERIRDAYIAHLEGDIKRFRAKLKYMDEPQEPLSKDDLKRHYENQIHSSEVTIDIIKNV